MIPDFMSIFGFALLHSLWQGLVLGFISVLILQVLKQSQHRYIAACLAFFLMPVSFAVTCFWVYTPDARGVFDYSLNYLGLNSFSGLGSPQAIFGSGFKLEPFLPNDIKESQRVSTVG